MDRARDDEWMDGWVEGRILDSRFAGKFLEETFSLVFGCGECECHHDRVTLDDPRLIHLSRASQPTNLRPTTTNQANINICISF